MGDRKWLQGSDFFPFSRIPLSDETQPVKSSTWWWWYQCKEAGDCSLVRTWCLESLYYIWGQTHHQKQMARFCSGYIIALRLHCLNPIFYKSEWQLAFWFLICLTWCTTSCLTHHCFYYLFLLGIWIMQELFMGVCIYIGQNNLFLHKKGSYQKLATAHFSSVFQNNFQV